MRLILVASALVGCTDAVLVEVASDRPVPQAIDNICVGIADPAGGHFGHAYRLEGAIATLPQSLRVVAGGASSAFAWVRGDRGGVPAARSAVAFDFGRDVTLSLPKCVIGPAAAPAVFGAAVGPAAADTRLAASAGATGTLVVAVGGGATAIVDAHGGNLVASAAPGAPPGKVVAVVAADLDGDCDDDIIVVTDGAAPTVWIRDGATFTAGGTIGTAAVAAIATADVDRDGDVDVVLGSGGTLQLWRNDGGAQFTHDAPALAGAGHVSSVSALALGDLDGDGNPDLIVGQAGAPLSAWLGEPGGTGSFLYSTAAVPPVALDVEALQLADADGDYDPDLAVAVRGMPMRLYIDRDGRLEDQSFVRLPQPAPIAHAIALGGWDDGCEPDAVIAADAGAATLRGQPGGAYATDAPAPAATDVIMTDIDDDGDLDALLATAQGVTWFAR